ncbi:LDLR chaperone boca [Patella vulgata]|uniref:LDLR chaperone boca n=1 Tax=Patella vulgata TaxID=6465 RepID=UPI0024A8406A|nr:LDLR chaperone boca [Patella vulgata]
MKAVAFLCLICFTYLLAAEKNTDEKVEEKDKWKKKKLQDYSEADLERLYDQWEESDEDELEEDEKPEWKKEPPKIDMSQIDPSNPESMLKMSKKGKTLMMFATVSGDPTEKETEQITQLWQSSLFNANIETQRYIVGANRAIFMLKDGGKAWEIKDFLIQQDRCLEVTIDNQNYPGKGAKNENKTAKKDKSATKKGNKSPNDIKKEEL